MFLERMELSEGINSAKYTLRTKSILKRIESERSRHTSSKKKENKEKEKPPPLSKYRRKTANARERNRMKEINDAFISLQSSLPGIPGTDSEKLTKITVLKLAVNYINALARVLDNSSPSMDVEDVREMWCHDNAHITKTDNCLKALEKTSPIKKEETCPKSNNSGNLKSTTFGAKITTTNPTTRKRPQVNAKNETIRDKFLHTIKPSSKKSGKSKSRGKICRTNSVATNNGAYITLKNCAMQTTHNSSKTRIINNQPLMMSMTVKRTRMEPIVGHRSIKMRKYEPQLTYATTDLTQFNTLSPCTNTNPLQLSSPNNNNSTSVANTNNIYESPTSITNTQYQFLPLHTINPEKCFQFDRLSSSQNSAANIQQHKPPIPSSPPSVYFPSNQSPVVNPVQKSNYQTPVTNNTLQYLSLQTSPENSFPMGGLTLPELDSPPVRNDVLLEFPRELKQTSSSDSAFSSSGESAPSSPTLSLHSHSPPLDSDFSPFSSLANLSGVSSSTSICSAADCDSVFNSLLECGAPFQDELDHFTSTFGEVPSNSFNLFMDQQQLPSAGFVNCDIDGY